MALDPILHHGMQPRTLAEVQAERDARDRNVVFLTDGRPDKYTMALSSLVMARDALKAGDLIKAELYAKAASQFIEDMIEERSDDR